MGGGSKVRGGDWGIARVASAQFLSGFEKDFKAGILEYYGMRSDEDTKGLGFRILGLRDSILLKATQTLKTYILKS